MGCVGFEAGASGRQPGPEVKISELSIDIATDPWGSWRTGQPACLWSAVPIMDTNSEGRICVLQVHGRHLAEE